MAEERKELDEKTMKDAEWILNEITHSAYMTVYKGKQEYDIFALRDVILKNIVRAGCAVEISEIRHIGESIWYPYFKVVKI